MSLDRIKDDLKGALVRLCRLSGQTQAADIDDQATFFAGGIGLDSIDILELVVYVEKQYDLKIRNDAEGQAALYSIETLAQAIHHAQPQ